MDSIYIDHAATTPLATRVNEVMYEYGKTIYGNPSSVHAFGREARKYIDEARMTVAHSLGGQESEVIFTSGGTEAINSALMGVALAHKKDGKHLITSNQEHQATLHTMRYLETNGFKVTYIETDETGCINIEQIKRAITDETILVSIMMVNNETGVIQPIEEIGAICAEKEIYFHTDAVQAFGPLDINVDQLQVDLLTISAHKVNGPKGVGALYVREGTHMQSLQFGGEQERKRRAGTENVIGIVGFAEAVKDIQQNRVNDQNNIQACAEAFLHALTKQDVNYTINGDRSKSVPGIINLSFPGTHVESMLMNLDIERIAASSGSACTAGTVEPSHVLQAMFGESSEEITNSIRFSFGKENTPEEMEEAAKRIAAIVQRIQA